MRLNTTVFIPRFSMLEFLRCLQLFRLLNIPTMDLYLITIPSPNLLRPSLVAYYTLSDSAEPLYTSTYVVVVAHIAVAES